MSDTGSKCEKKERERELRMRKMSSLVGFLRPYVGVPFSIGVFTIEVVLGVN